MIMKKRKQKMEKIVLSRIAIKASTLLMRNRMRLTATITGTAITIKSEELRVILSVELTQI